MQREGNFVASTFAAGPCTTIIIGGACCVVAAAVFLSGLEQLRESVRPINRRRGILPEIRTAAGEAGQLTFEARD